MRVLGLKMTVMNVIILILALLGLLQVSGKKEHLFGNLSKWDSPRNAILNSAAFKAKMQAKQDQATAAKKDKAFRKCKRGGGALIGPTGCYCKYKNHSCKITQY